MTDFLLDDFLQMEDIGGTEDIKLVGECTIEKDGFYSDLLDSTYVPHLKSLNPEAENAPNHHDVMEKHDKDLFFIINCPSEILPCLGDQLQDADCSNDLPSKPENTTPPSSVSQEFTSPLLNTSGNENETFTDLSVMLEKEHSSVPFSDENSSKEISALTDTITNTSPSSSNVCLHSTNSNEQYEQPSDSSQKSDVSCDSEEVWEPSRKVPKLSSKSKSVSWDSKYKEMRRKNNFASRRSRQSKKQQEKEMEEKAIALEKENESLRIKEKKLEELVDKLRQMLFSSVSKKK